MVCEKLNPAITFPQLDVKDMADVMTQIGGVMTREGYGKDTYTTALIEREKEFPTALDVDGIGVAIPHTPAEHVLKNGIAVATLKKPVTFIAMGSDDEEVQVELIFMLAIAGGHGHIDELQELLGIIQDTDLLKKLKSAKTANEILTIISEKENAQ